MLTKVWKELNRSVEVADRWTLAEYDEKRGHTTVFLYTMRNGAKYIVDCTDGECTQISRIRPEV